MSKPSLRSELARDISREYQSAPPTKYDATLNALRWLGPQIPHKFHKCYSDKQEKVEQALKIKNSGPNALRILNQTIKQNG